jgi:hypothetical protein
MTDVEIEPSCSTYDAKTGKCRLMGWSCPFASSGFTDCGQCTRLAKVRMPPDEFHVLLDRNNKPTAGYVPLTRCRVTDLHPGAGVHVNLIMQTTGTEPVLDLQTHADGTVTLRCNHSDAAVTWRDGQFEPAW